MNIHIELAGLYNLYGPIVQWDTRLICRSGKCCQGNAAKHCCMPRAGKFFHSIRNQNWLPLNGARRKLASEWPRLWDLARSAASGEKRRGSTVPAAALSDVRASAGPLVHSAESSHSESPRGEGASPAPGPCDRAPKRAVWLSCFRGLSTKPAVVCLALPSCPSRHSGHA